MLPTILLRVSGNSILLVILIFYTICRYFLGPSCVPGTVLGARDKVGEKSQRVVFPWGEAGQETSQLTNDGSYKLSMS